MKFSSLHVCSVKVRNVGGIAILLSIDFINDRLAQVAHKAEYLIQVLNGFSTSETRSTNRS